MILGVGIDLVDIFRIDKILEKYPRQFANEFSEERIRTYENFVFRFEAEEKANRFIAKRLAAKEAVSRHGSRGQISLKTIQVQMIV